MYIEDKKEVTINEIINLIKDLNNFSEETSMFIEFNKQRILNLSNNN